MERADPQLAALHRQQARSGAGVRLRDMLADALERLRQAAAPVLDAEPVVVAYLFGSQADGGARPGSDVDVAVLVGEEVSPGAYLDLRLRLAGNLERALGSGPVEVVVLNEAPLRLQGRVLWANTVLYSRNEPLRVRYESLTRRVHLDFEPKAAELDRELLRAHAQGRR